MTVKDIIQQVEQLSPEEWRELFLYMQQGQKYATLPKGESEDEMSKEEIIQSLRQSMKQALSGNVRPAREALEEIERELREDANES